MNYFRSKNARVNTTRVTLENVEILEFTFELMHGIIIASCLGSLYVHTTEEQKHKEIDLVVDALKVI